MKKIFRTIFDGKDGDNEWHKFASEITVRRIRKERELNFKWRRRGIEARIVCDESGRVRWIDFIVGEEVK